MASRNLIPVSGRLTEVIKVPVRPGAVARLQALVIPGNPGSAGYYVPFMLSLRDAFSGGIEVLAVSQLGHGLDYNTELYSLKEQIAHKVDFMREQMLLEGKPPIVVMGHSIGAYMALKAVEMIEKAKNKADLPSIDKVVALCPTLAIPAAKDTWRQWGLRNLVRAPIITGYICGFLGLLPSTLQRGVVFLGGGRMGEHAVETTIALFRLSTGYNAAFLARTEFSDLASPADWCLLRSLGKRCVVICAPDDQWFQNWKWEQMWLEIPEIQAHLEEYISHGFCVSIQQSKRLAERLGGLLEPQQGAQHSVQP